MNTPCFLCLRLKIRSRFNIVSLVRNQLSLPENMVAGSDEITEKYFNHRLATVQGFIGGSMISFIRQYPCYCTIDEAGNVTLYENQPAAEIHYSGILVQLSRRKKRNPSSL